MQKLLFILTLSSLTSCAIVSKQNCAEYDWTQRAKEDLQKNRDWEKYLVRYNKVCKKHGYAITEAYMNGIEAKGGKACTGFEDFPQSGWAGVGARDALKYSDEPSPEKYAENCAKYKMLVNVTAFNEGVKSVGGEACASFKDFKEKGWRGVGKRDAKSGSLNNLKAYQQKCSEHYFTDVNEEEFNEGYAEGLKAFCTKKSGYEFSKGGGSYKKTCTINEKSFLKGYKIGSELRTAEVLEKNLKSALSKSDKITNDINTWLSEIENLKIDLNSKLKSYKEEKEKIENEIEIYTSRLKKETAPDKKEELEEKLKGLRSDLVELQDKTLNSETSNEKALEEARFAISKLGEEQRLLKLQIKTLKSQYKTARLKSEKSLKGL